MIILIGGKWLRVPTQLLTCDELTRADIAVWCYVADRIGDSIAPVSKAQICEACELSESTVKRSLRKLVGLHYLHAQERSGAPTAYRQTLLEPKRKPGAKKAPENETDPEIEKYMVVMNKFPDPDPGKEVI